MLCIWRWRRIGQASYPVFYNYRVKARRGKSCASWCVLQECVKLGVRKFNVNTEVRAAYMKSLVKGGKDVVDVMRISKAMMQEVVEQKMQMFGSAGKGL